MPFLLLVPLFVILAYVYWRRRSGTLTRNCRWRENRAAGVGHYHCVSCDGLIETKDGKAPQDCVANATRKTGGSGV